MATTIGAVADPHMLILHHTATGCVPMARQAARALPGSLQGPYMKWIERT
ncbi:hypothetical protein [Novosphingobium resinovorum]|nr:hypothetical protein [Novosphingobium resinovorum]